jgi:hypothetical protein
MTSHTHRTTDLDRAMMVEVGAYFLDKHGYLAARHVVRNVPCSIDNDEREAIVFAFAILSRTGGNRGK